MKKLNIILGLVFLAIFSLSAQVTIMTPSMDVDPNASIQFDVKASSTDSIVGMQFTLKWDPTVLNFQQVSELVLPSSMGLGNHFGDLGNGVLTFVWTEENLEGLVLGNEATLFSLDFKVVGPNNSSTLVEVTGDPTLIEVATADEVLEVTLDNGTVNVGTTSTTESMTTDFVLFQNTPNPVTEFTNITFELNNRTDADLSIYNTSGKLILVQSTNGSGLQTITIQREAFPAAGTYFYELKTDNAIARRKLIVQ
jgi:hypothetical protein